MGKGYHFWGHLEIPGKVTPREFLVDAMNG